MHAIFTPKLIVSYPDLDFILAYPMFKNVPYVRLTVNLPCWNLSVQAKKTIPSDTLDSVGKYYAVYYTGPRFTYYCMGNENIKTFNDDDEGPVTKVEIDCLKKKKKIKWLKGVDIDHESKNRHLIVDKDYVFCGPEVRTYDEEKHF